MDTSSVIFYGSKKKMDALNKITKNKMVVLSLTTKNKMDKPSVIFYGQNQMNALNKTAKIKCLAGNINHKN